MRLPLSTLIRSITLTAMVGLPIGGLSAAIIAWPSVLPGKIWLNIGDSIMSGDGAAYAKGQGRPPDDAWAASEDGRASYGFLIAQH